MSSATCLSENSTALLHPDDGKTNVIADPSLASMRGYELILNDATKQILAHPRHTASMRGYELILNDATKQILAHPRYTNSRRSYGLVPNDATKQVWQYPRPTIRDSFEKTIIEFSDALEYSFENSIIEFSDALEYSFENPIIEFSDALELPFVDIAEGFTSFNKSVFDVGTSNPVVEAQLERLFSVAHEEQFEVGIESQFSGSLQRLSAYDPVAVLQSLKARLIDSDASSEVLAEILRWASRQEADAIHDLVADLLSAGLQHGSSLVARRRGVGFSLLG